MNKTVGVIGGGIAGIETAASLAELGHNVVLYEKEDSLGGKMNQWHKLFPNIRSSEEIRDYLHNRAGTPGITTKTNTMVAAIQKNHKGFYLDTGEKDFVDAVVICSGFDLFAAERKEEYGYRIYENVITSADLEQMFIRKGKPETSRGELPKRIAFIHCVGSRDAKSGNLYCSKVCCVTAVKQAIEVNKTSPHTEIFCFYMDLRMHGLEYEELYKTAQEKHNVQFIRGRLSEVSENMDHSILVKAEDTLSGRPLKMVVDLAVLMAGMEAGQSTTNLGISSGLDFNSQGFLEVRDIHTGRNLSSTQGIFLAGTCCCPMSIADTTGHARSAALEVHRYLNSLIL